MQNHPKYELELMRIPLTEKIPLYIHDHLRHPPREIVYLHRHNCMELGLCVEGEGIFVVEEKIMSYRTGDMTLIGTAEAHLAASSPGTTSHWIWFYLDFEKLLLPHFPEMDLDFLSRLHGGRFRNVLKREEHAWGRPILEALFRASYPEEKIAWCVLLALRLKETFGGSCLAEAKENGNGEFERIAKAVSYFGKHYAERVSIPAVARLCGMSMTNFRRVFKAETGASPQDYLNRLRICMAKAELRSGKYRIFEVAARCGFPSLSSFNRQFRKQTGRAPREAAK